MKLNIIVVLIVSITAFSVEQELKYDYGNTPPPYWVSFSSSMNGRICNDFIAPYICHIAKIKLVQQGGTQSTAFVWDDNLNFPGNILGQKFFSYIYQGSWETLDISELHITRNAGQKFYCGFQTGQGASIIDAIGYETNTLPLHYYFTSVNGGVSWTYQPNRNLYIRCVIDNDMTPPYVNGQVPAPESNVNPPLNAFVFHCRDDDKGVDPDTILFTCTGNGNPIPGTLSWDDSDIHNIICTFTPDTPIPGGICVLCHVHSGLADGLGNTTTSDIAWWFTVGATKVRTDSLGSLKALFR
jgi:hypothetical protein